MLLMSTLLRKKPAPIVSLVGHTVRWRFDDGPVAGKSFEHRFIDDGSVEFRMLDAAGKGRWMHEDRCATTTLADGVFAISYPSRTGYTLSAVLNLTTRRVVAFASNESDWQVQEGTFELVR
jgi:phenolic acid decarboxylase